MRSMKVDGKYRILEDGQYLPDEVPQQEMDGALKELKDAVKHVCDVLEGIHHRYDIVSDVVSELMESACLNYSDGREWHLGCLVDEIEQMQKALAEQDDDILPYEESETILDVGYQTEHYGYDSGIYVKVLEDSDEREVVEEVIVGRDEPIHRLRTTIWEVVPYGKHSKEIGYEDLPINENLKRLMRNTEARWKAMKKS